jgi:hypothetical protein
MSMAPSILPFPLVVGVEAAHAGSGMIVSSGWAGTAPVVAKDARAMLLLPIQVREVGE